jgi:hypothetical protein
VLVTVEVTVEPLTPLLVVEVVTLSSPMVLVTVEVAVIVGEGIAVDKEVMEEDVEGSLLVVATVEDSDDEDGFEDDVCGEFVRLIVVVKIVVCEVTDGLIEDDGVLFPTLVTSLVISPSVEVDLVVPIKGAWGRWNSSARLCA